MRARTLRVWARWEQRCRQVQAQAQWNCVCVQPRRVSVQRVHVRAHVRASGCVRWAVLQREQVPVRRAQVGAVVGAEAGIRVRVASVALERAGVQWRA